MSPEQAKGKRVDTRTDIWAFGAVVYEMLTGKRAFEGEEVSEVLASVIKSEPDWSLLPAAIPPVLRTFLKRSLEKDPKRRVRDIGDVRLALHGAFDPGDASETASPRPERRTAWLGALALALGALLGGAAAWALLGTAETPRASTRLGIQLSDDQRFNATGRHVFAVAPDGSYIVYSAQ